MSLEAAYEAQLEDEMNWLVAYVDGVFNILKDRVEKFDNLPDRQNAYEAKHKAEMLVEELNEYIYWLETMEV